MAMQVTDQATLDNLLAGAQPFVREAMLERLLPYLPFVPREYETPDCPHCGLERGSAIAHSCSLLSD